MRLLCNFVNVNTIAYRVQYTFTHVHARTPTDILARESAPRVGQVGGQVGEDHHACSARGKLNGEVAGHADILATILTRKSARMSESVSVSVLVSWNFSLNERGLWKNGLLDRDAVWGGGSGDTRESCIRWACTLAPPGKYI